MIAFGAIFLLFALSGAFSETAGRVIFVAAAMLAGAAFLPVCSRTARQYVAFLQWWIPLIYMTFLVAFLFEGWATRDFLFFIFWTPLFSAISLVLQFRPGWYLRASSAISLLGFVVQPPVWCIASANLEASYSGECFTTQYQATAPIIGVCGLILLDQLAKTLAKHTMARRAFKASRGLHRL